MTPKFNIAVYCSAAAGLPESWIAAAERLGRWIAETGSTLVYGGVDAGLMRVTANAAKSASPETRIVGVVPALRKSQASPANDVVIPAETLHDRKKKMIDLADVFVALPGGYGTLDEIASTLADLRFNSVAAKRIIILNLDGIYDPFVAQLRLIADKGLMNPDAFATLEVADSTDKMITLLDNIRNGKI